MLRRYGESAANSIAPCCLPLGVDPAQGWTSLGCEYYAQAADQPFLRRLCLAAAHCRARQMLSCPLWSRRRVTRRPWREHFI